MLTRDQIEAAAESLEMAERERRQIGLLSLQHRQMTLDDAYAVQAALVRRKIARGRKPVGWKIGLTSKAMQAALGIDIPDSGVLFDDMMFADGAAIPPDRFIQPRIEAEIAFAMKADIEGPEVGAAQVVAATDYITPSLEILDTRILRVDPETSKTRTIVDTIADNAANAGLVLGGQRICPDDVDMRWMGAVVSRNGEVEETGLGAGVLNDPALGIAWLANRLAEHGERIRAGDIVLSGSFIRPIEVRHGDEILADFGPHGTVRCHFM